VSYTHALYSMISLNNNSGLQFSWLYLVVLLVLIGLIISLRQFEIARMRMKNQIEISRLETKNLQEMDLRKSRFFANISHQFRTPLTLIKGPLNEMIAESTDLKEKKTLQIMNSNASHLLDLINQLLELSKIESGHYILKVSKGDFLAFFKGTVMSFSSLADSKKIRLTYKIAPELETEHFREDFYYDADIVQKILNNILSNAFKFTPLNGQVNCNLSLSSRSDGTEILQISITDSGIGLQKDKVEFIFDRFYKSESESNSDDHSSGIGLAYVKELVQVHQSKILVESKFGHGSSFTLLFPIGEAEYKDYQIIKEILPQSDQIQLIERTPQLLNVPATLYNDIEIHDKPWALIIEDQDDVRHYIMHCLQRDFRLLQAPDGRSGFVMAEEFIPDLIISDIMMPRMDGFRLCDMIKNSEKTSHIPIILLTAKADEKDKMSGLGSGADDYITKPFDPKELSIRSKNLVDNRRILREKFSSNNIIRPEEISVSPQENGFMEKILGLIEKNIGIASYSIENLASEAGMSHSQLNRKLKAIVNMSANQFVRSVRLHRAKELIQKGVGNISEIAYMVGYEDPGYFTKSFRNFFGKLPSEITVTNSAEL
jgi:signal transduction histidine kinase/DNA-binding response OmpR family regulator